jgi:N-acetylglutamate synthase-like GNAT family acetyltransferase
MRLDPENLRAEQFIVLREGSKTVAFGRIKPYAKVYELGCVGVVEEARGKGYGQRIVRELIRRFPIPEVYITTDLPSYFEPLGFQRIQQGPPEIFEKISRICGALRQNVVAMVLIKSP